MFFVAARSHVDVRDVLALVPGDVLARASTTRASIAPASARRGVGSPEIHSRRPLKPQPKQS